MNYTPFKQKETCTDIANKIYKSVDTILTNKSRIKGLDIVQLFTNLNFLKICTYEMDTDTDFIVHSSNIDFPGAYENRLIWMFAINLRDILKITEPFSEFSELNKYMYEVLNAEKN